MRPLYIVLWSILVVLAKAAVAADGPANPEALLARLEAYPHARNIELSTVQVVDHEIGLGAMQKVRGDWRFKDSERQSGELTRSTWQIVDGFSSQELLEELTAILDGWEGVTRLFACEGRACGHGAQWANRVFKQRVLYGRQEMQRYRVYRVLADAEYRLVLYTAERTADRQYLQLELLKLAEKEPEAAEL